MTNQGTEQFIRNQKIQSLRDRQAANRAAIDALVAALAKYDVADYDSRKPLIDMIHERHDENIRLSNEIAAIRSGIK